jgi:hypothetical protein
MVVVVVVVVVVVGGVGGGGVCSLYHYSLPLLLMIQSLLTIQLFHHTNALVPLLILHCLMQQPIHFGQWGIRGGQVRSRETLLGLFGRGLHAAAERTVGGWWRRIPVCQKQRTARSCEPKHVDDGCQRGRGRECRGRRHRQCRAHLGSVRGLVVDGGWWLLVVFVGGGGWWWWWWWWWLYL